MRLEADTLQRIAMSNVTETYRYVAIVEALLLVQLKEITAKEAAALISATGMQADEGTVRSLLSRFVKSFRIRNGRAVD